jgi:hypothetical protein
MTGHEPDAAQAAFERSLFESARGDAPPPGASERAWCRFAADAALLAPLAVASAPRRWLDSAAARAAKWTLIGAVGGGGLVAVWLRPPSPGELRVAPAPAVLELPSLATAADIAVPSLAAPPVEPAPASAPSASHVARLRKPYTASPVSRASKSSPAESLLAREVAALDAARTAIAVGANASALRQIEQYHREFPSGELSADADVVAIEALAAEGDAPATKRAARRFLQQHARDPHVARIRELAR